MERKMDEQDILREVGIHRDAYRGSWVYESFVSLPEVFDLVSKDTVVKVD